MLNEWICEPFVIFREHHWGRSVTDISLEAVTGKLNRAGYDAFIQALRHAKSAGNRNVELAHWLFHILQQERTDLSLSADHYKIDRAPPDVRPRRRHQRVSEERDRHAWRRQLGGRCARPRLALRHAVFRRNSDPDRSRAGGRAEIERYSRVRSTTFRRSSPRSMSMRWRPSIAPSGQDPRKRTCGRWTVRDCARPAQPGADQRRRSQRHHPARSLLAGPHRESQVRRDGSHPRPRQRNTAADRRPDAAPSEQSRSSRARPASARRPSSRDLRSASPRATFRRRSRTCGYARSISA